MKKITFYEYELVLSQQEAELIITDEDERLLRNNELTLSDIAHKYDTDIEWRVSEIDYETGEHESFEGLVFEDEDEEEVA
jgi:hypothetical protein